MSVAHPGARVVVFAALLLAACAGPAHPAAWPESRAGELARRWVEAFSAGEEAMRRYWSDHLAAEALAAKPVEERLAGYRDLHAKLGALRLVEVVDESAPGELTARLAAADDAEVEATFRFEAVEPGKLLRVTLRITEGKGHGLFPFHHGG